MERLMETYTNRDRYTMEGICCTSCSCFAARMDSAWDREQDHHTIRRNMIEEAYEAVESH